MYETLLILHILSAILFGGGIIASLVLRLATRGWQSTSAIALAAGLQVRLSQWAVVPGALLAVLLGTALVFEAGFDLVSGWVIGAYALWLVTMGIGGSVVGRHEQEVGRRARLLLDEGVEESADLQREYGASRVLIAGLLLGLFVVIFEYLMVAKPGA